MSTHGMVEMVQDSPTYTGRSIGNGRFSSTWSPSLVTVKKSSGLTTSTVIAMTPLDGGGLRDEVVGNAPIHLSLLGG